MVGLSKTVWMVQLSEEQGSFWYAALKSQQIQVSWEPASTDIIQLLERSQSENKPLPNLLLIDMGITAVNVNSLLAPLICRWCRQHQSDIKVILTNPRQDEIGAIEMRWAQRQGAIELLPRLYDKTLITNVQRVMAALACEFLEEPLQQFLHSLTQSQSIAASLETEVSRNSSTSIREKATAELVRKMAMIPLIVMSEDSAQSSITQTENNSSNISLSATLGEMVLHELQIDVEQPGADIREAFKANPLLPGVILTDAGKFVGMISRRCFLEFLSRPFGIELFSKRPARILYQHAHIENLILHGATPVVMAAQMALQRPLESLYEPIVVQRESQAHGLLDIHNLFLAQSQIHELATKLLREQTQESMIQTEKMASLGQMVAEISHDIRNPINFIHNNLDYLTEYSHSLLRLISAYKQELPKPSAHIVNLTEELDFDFIEKDLANVIKSITLGAETLMSLATGLHSFSHVDKDVPSFVDVHECLENSLTILNSRLKNRVQVIKKYGDFATLTGFRGQLVQVFMNILSNAIDALMSKAEKLARVDQPKHLSENREVIATIVEPWQPRIEITTRTTAIEDDLGNRSEWLVIAIADNGLGIPKEVQDRIFETFFTTKSVGKGTGLGLAITHQIVTQKHQGKISLRSPCFAIKDEQSACGTEFEVRLPLTPN